MAGSRTVKDCSLDELASRYPDAGRLDFGDTAALSAHLIGLVRTERNTAICAALRDYEQESASPPKGRRI